MNMSQSRQSEEKARLGPGRADVSPLSQCQCSLGLVLVALRRLRPFFSVALPQTAEAVSLCLIFFIRLHA